ncbi:hypothetical protein [Hufsiella ginkgonis]|uniref:Uncharacterized protein n=1 Tax=Hufsiella ginkgonis TaxID=2695274 RepID=A0A7K1Y057_9SPHI|nr:hypothetical protein [Hufsiella ginkgonis]MXV16600.1 hypothetical protein [Hufsiella ginkgonis]
MKKFLKITFAAFAFFVVFMITCMGFRPVDTTGENAVTVNARILSVYEAGTKDAVFEVAGNPRVMYINRGLEHGLRLNELRSTLVGKTVEISYARHWTLFPSSLNSKHIVALKMGEKVIYSELD